MLTQPARSIEELPPQRWAAVRQHWQNERPAPARPICVKGLLMNRSPSLIMESIAQAKSTMVTLHDRTSSSGSIDDRAELSVLHTTVRTIEELLQIATEYDDVLRQQLARTDGRIKAGLGKEHPFPV